MTKIVAFFMAIFTWLGAIFLPGRLTGEGTFTDTPAKVQTEFDEGEFVMGENDLVVAPDGDDSNPGTPEAPLKTLEKAKEIECADNMTFTADEERDLVKTLSRFPEKVLEALEAYEPSIITRYILDVATAFNRFYHNCHILSVENGDVLSTRIALTKATNYVLGNAFELICLKKTEKI